MHPLLNPLRLIALTLILLGNNLHVSAQGHIYNKMQITIQPALNVSDGQGVSGAFAGLIDNKVTVIGGCNFPATPAADNGKKVFYDKVWQLEDAHWMQNNSLVVDHALAYGASVQTHDGLICLGGTDGEYEYSDVVLYQSVNFFGSNALTKDLPRLPLSLQNFAAALGGDYIYVAGGTSQGQVNHHAYRLKYPNGTQWEQLPDMPGLGRVQPCGVVQNGNIGLNFYVFGGYDPEKKVALTDGIFYNPRDNCWQSTSAIIPEPNGRPMALIGASAVASGASHIIFFGGVNKDIFEEAIRHPQDDYLRHPAEWYRFNTAPITYQTITNEWTHIYRLDELEHPYVVTDKCLARAGASIVTMPDNLNKPHWYIINGENKPGMRSDAVNRVTIDYEADFGWLNWTVLIGYLLGMLALGFYFMNHNSSSEDFFRGGCRIPWWAAGISIFATMLSAITYMSIPAKAYATDWTYYPMQVCILLISFPVIKYYLPFFRRLNVTTAYEYLELRFSYTTRFTASILFIVFMIARMALVLFLPSLAMSAVTGINIFFCIIAMSVITIIYCTTGGVEAVVWGDVIQGIILVLGAFFAAGYLILNTADGVTNFLTISIAEDKFRLFDWSLDWHNATFWVVILGGLANNLISYTSDQTVIQRYLTTKDEKSAARGIITNGMMSVIVTIAFFTIGTGLYTFYKTHPAEMDFTMGKTDAIFPFFIMSQMPAGVAGLLFAAIFAATMSTISSNINSISTAFTVDIYKRWNPKINDQDTVQIARITSVGTGIIGMIIAILMALTTIQSLLDYFNTILGLLSGGIGALFVMGIFFPRISANNAFIGFLCGTGIVFYMYFCSDANFLLYGFASITVSLIVALLLSFLRPEPDPHKGLTWETLKKKTVKDS